MRYTVSVSEVRILGHLWWPMAPLAATCKQLDPYDVQNIKGEAAQLGEPAVTREAVEQWLTSNCGDFSEVVDFSASLEVDGQTVDIPWADEDHECDYSDCMYPGED